jgi:hypothetical protein
VTPPAEKKKRPGLFFLVGCAGCAFLLLLIGVGGTMGWLLWQQNRGPREALPVAWRDSLRELYRLPASVARLATVPTESGDASALLQANHVDDAGAARMRAARHLLGSGTLTPADSAAIRGALHDSAAAVAAAAARQSHYELAAFLDRATSPHLMPPLGPGLSMAGWLGMSRAVDALTLRGEARRWRGDRAGAKQDFAAVIALGRLAWLREVSSLGPNAGRRIMRSGAAGLARVALQSGDRRLAAEADALSAWGTPPLGYFRFIGPLPPDSLLLVAQDTALPRGVRASALENACWGSIFRPIWRLITGPSGSLMAGTRALRHDPDPVVARAAEMADSTLGLLDHMGIRNRYRVAAGKSVR